MKMDMQSYRIIVVDDTVSLHHVTCSEKDTKVLEWPKNFPGGMSLETIFAEAVTHDACLHH